MLLLGVQIINLDFGDISLWSPQIRIVINL